MSIARTLRLGGASLAVALLAVACSQDASEDAQTLDLSVEEVSSDVREARQGRPGSRVESGQSGAAGDAFATGGGGARGVLGGSAPKMASAPPPPAEPAPPAPAPTAGSSGQSTDTPAPPMLIRTGQVSVEVDSLEPAVARVQAAVSQLGGYVANTMIQTGRGERRSARIEVRVPSTRFDAAMSAMRPLGKVESFNVSTQDVGEEYVDVAARMANAERLEQRLVTLLATRTGKLEDVLAVERELARVREEIERYEGRLRYLRTQTSFSTIALHVHEPAPVLEPRIGPSPIAGAFRQAWRNFVALVAGIIASLGIVLPLAVIVALLVWLWRRFGPKPAPLAMAPRTPGAPGAPGAPPTTSDRRDVA